MQSRARLYWVVLAALLAASGVAHSATLSLSPVRGVIKPGQRSASFELRNPSDQPLLVQVESGRWTQSDGRDQVTPDDALIVAPTVVRLPPQGRQIVRVALRTPAVSANELSYRLKFRELPPPPAPGEVGVRTVVEMSVPLFVPPAVKATDSGSMSCKLLASGEIEFTRDAPIHYRFTRLRAVDSSGRETLLHDGQVYVLAGAQRRIALPGATRALAGQKLTMDAAGKDSVTCDLATF